MEFYRRMKLIYPNETDGVEVQLGFGYYRNEPTMAVLYKDELILIPKDVLVTALQEGWDEDYSIIHEDGGITTIHKEQKNVS